MQNSNSTTNTTKRAHTVTTTTKTKLQHTQNKQPIHTTTTKQYFIKQQTEHTHTTV